MRYEKAFHNKDISNTRFLITGGAGFIGSHLTEYLLTHKAGYVRVLDNLSNGYMKNIEAFLSFPNFEFIKGDIVNADTCAKACEGVHIVLHQAALGSVPRSINDPVSTNQANVDGFLNMLVAARDCIVQRFVYASSSSVYGDNPDIPKKEEKTGRPLSPYAVSKMVDELYAGVFGPLFNMQLIGLRYFNIFGPRQNPHGQYAAAIPLFINALLDGRAPLIYGDGKQTRDFTFVENAVQANILAALTDKEDASGQVFNIAVGEKTEVLHLFDCLKELSNSTLEARFAEERPGDIKETMADISKAKAILGYKPATSFKEGLEITLEWFRNNR